MEQVHDRGPVLRRRSLLLPGCSGAAQALTIKANLRAIRQPRASLNPCNKTLFKTTRFEPAHHPVERVVRGNARREGQIPTQPRQFSQAKIDDFVPFFVPAQAGTHAQGQNFQQRVLPPTYQARVGKYRKIRQK